MPALPSMLASACRGSASTKGAARRREKTERQAMTFSRSDRTVRDVRAALGAVACFMGTSAFAQCVPPQIAVGGQPAPAAACDHVAMFSVTAVEAFVSHAWQYSTRDGFWNDWSDYLISDLDDPVASLSGGNTGRLRVAAIASNESVQFFGTHAVQFRCVLTNACGGRTISQPASLSVCFADFSCDGVVDDADFVVFAAAYDVLGCAALPPPCVADINGDGLVEDADFVHFARAYEKLLCS